ncbi:MAG TPA: hypothetical protein VN445_08100 [Rectinemataceae bacterium]|nr:hypothetical protein [Rectinemataceae bacterium]
MFRKTLALCLGFVLAFPLLAQSGGASPSTSPEGAPSDGLSGGLPGEVAAASTVDETATMSELERKTLALDIAISNYYELKALAQKYGLSTEGLSQELRDRLYAHLKLAPPATPAPASSVTIESASNFEYFTLDGSADSFMRLSGPITMKISTDDGFRHVVKADEIIFNRDENIVQAKGDVTYVREGEGRSDEFKGSTILVDLDSYSGVFLDGVYNLDPSATVKRSLSFHFEKLTRRGADLTVLESALVTACDDDRPHYYIRARKVWLFENGDWALSGATLYLGVVPVLWLPFFYYPSDEIVFHPVIGYRSREGAFVQTTTYLLGEMKKTTDSSSSLSLLSQQGASGKKALSGIFIKRLQTALESGGAKAASPSDARSLKLLADIYSALGLYVGISGAIPETSTGSLDFSLGMGLSRSLFLESNGYYSPFDYANGYVSNWNSSNFLGFDLPFRFGGDATYSYKKISGPLRFSIALKMPLYSDPYFEQDFYQRSESSSILSAIDANTTTVSKRTSLTQSLQSSLSWTAQNIKGASLLQSANISKLAAQMTWKSKSQPTTGLTSAQKRMLAVDPQRDFFYPDSLKFLDSSFSLSGTILQRDSQAKKTKAGAATPGSAEDSISSEGAGSATAPEGAKGAASSGGAAPPAESTEAMSQPAVAPQPEAATQPEASSSTVEIKPRDFSQSSVNIGWTASGSSSVEEKFYSTDWVYPEDVDTTLSYLLVGWKGNATLTSSSSWAEKLIALQTSLGFSSQDQWRPYLKDERTSPTTVHPYRLSDYSYRSTTVDASAALSVSPFQSGSAWSASSLQYSIGGTLYKNNYSGLSGSGVDATPIYTSTWIGWDSDTLSSHALSATVSLAPRNKASQRLSFAASLPPLLEKYSATYAYSRKFLQTSFLGAVSRASDGADLLPSSLSAQIVLGAAPYPVLSSEFSWDFDEAAPLSSVTSLGYGWAKVAFTAKKSKGYSFTDGLWSTDGTESFRPYETSFSLTPKIGDSSAKTVEGGSALHLYVRPTISYSQNLVRFTESTLGASMDFSLTSDKGTSLSFTSVSANKSAWRYWPSLFPASGSFDPTDYYRNFLTDLADSLSIWDSAKLKSSLFKLQSLNLKLAQDLHDWNLEAALGMSPVLVTPDSGRPYYQLDFSFSIAVTWKDIPEMKASKTYEEGGFTD